MKVTVKKKKRSEDVDGEEALGEKRLTRYMREEI